MNADETWTMSKNAGPCPKGSSASFAALPDSHWIIIGLGKNLNVAMAVDARNAIKFLVARSKITELDAPTRCAASR